LRPSERIAEGIITQSRFHHLPDGQAIPMEEPQDAGGCEYLNTRLEFALDYANRIIKIPKRGPMQEASSCWIINVG